MPPMRRALQWGGAWMVFWAAIPAIAQQPLSLEEAIQKALSQSPVMRAADAAESAAVEHINQVRANYLPSVNYTESVQYGTNPVYVFGSLLEQHQFQSSNFELDRLNRPDPLSNFSTQLTIEQILFDGKKNAGRLQAAQTAVNMTEQQKRQSEMDLLEAVTVAYYSAVVAQEELRVAEESLRLADADLERAQSMRDTGQTTDADVLSLRVNRAAVLERRIRAQSAVLVAMARLNDRLGERLDTEYNFSTPLQPAVPVPAPLEQLEQTAEQKRPETQQADLAVTLAQTNGDLAHRSFLPDVAIHGILGVNRQYFVTRGGSDWMVGATLRWNLFHGFSDRSRVREATLLTTQREEEKRKASSAVRLQVRRAYLDLEAANSRIDVAQAGIDEAEESHRILANRYEAGLATATDLLRGQTALEEAKSRLLSAIFDQRVATVHLARATGTLTTSSAAVQP